MPSATPTGDHMTRARSLLECGLDVDDVAQMIANADEAETEIAWLKRVYSVFIEASPPGDQKAFAERCFDAEAKQCEVDQAFDYLFDDEWMVKLHHNGEDRVLAIGRHSTKPMESAVAGTRAEAIIRLAAKVAEATKAVETKGA